jgi:exopolyphosphatase/guanosine-5'-triphosphate,3'-diphosphate pyrophosphatase
MRVADHQAHRQTRQEAGMEAHIVASAFASLPAYAAIDLGTNNCRLLIGSAEGEGFRVLDSFSRIVRLGEGLQATGRLSLPAMDRAMAALHACAAKLRRRPVQGLYAIATEACRRASNGADFLSAARAETGLPIEVISTREEVELALDSCRPLLPANGRRVLLFDIGGGSTELAWIRLEQGRPHLIGYDSLPIGVATLADQFGPAGGAPAGFARMVDHVAGRLTAFEQVHRIAAEVRHGGVLLLGTSGTVTTLASIAMDLPRYQRGLVDGTLLSASEATEALAVLLDLGEEGRALHPCIGGERSAFVMPGCAIFEAIHTAWPASQVLVADRGLREGMLLRQIHGGVHGAARRRPARA